MNDQEQIEALDELDGWEPLPEGHFHPDNPIGQRPPSYLTSRDAIIPVIEKLDNECFTKFQSFLCQIVSKENNTLTHLVTFRMMFEATPKQLAEALLRATGKWKQTNKDLAPLFGADLD